MRVPFEIQKDIKSCKAKIKRLEKFIKQCQDLQEKAGIKLEENKPLENSVLSEERLKFLTSDLDFKAIQLDVANSKAKITMLEDDIEKLEQELKKSQFVWDSVTAQMNNGKMSHDEIGKSVQDAINEYGKQ